MILSQLQPKISHSSTNPNIEHIYLHSDHLSSNLETRFCRDMFNQRHLYHCIKFIIQHHLFHGYKKCNHTILQLILEKISSQEHLQSAVKVIKKKEKNTQLHFFMIMLLRKVTLNSFNMLKRELSYDRNHQTVTNLPYL